MAEHIAQLLQMDAMENTGIAKAAGVGCVSFLLDDDSLFFGTGFKVLQAQHAQNLIPCVRSRMNGKRKLTYFTEDMRALSIAARTMDSKHVLLALTSLVSAVLHIRDIGFLSITDVLVDADNVYIAVERCEAHVIYLPVNTPISGFDENEIHKKLCSTVVRVLDIAHLTDASARALRTYAQTGVGSLGALLNALQTASGGVGEISNNTKADLQSGSNRRPLSGFVLRYEAHPSLYVPIPIGKTVLGKSEQRADKVIRVSAAVSRAHCVIESSGSMLTVTDLGSSNGTFINGVRLRKGDPASIAVGDRLRLADVVFSVVEQGRAQQ